MTETLVRPAEPASPAPAGRRGRAALAVLPWLVPFAAFVALLLWTHTPVRDIAIYAAYLAIGVVLPGTLVHRALRGSRGNLPEDLGLGAATGLLLQLAGWLLAAATGAQALLRYWPLLFIVAFLAVPGLRRHWRIAEPRPLPLRWSWLTAGALLMVVALGASFWVSTPLPPATTEYYQDLMYHLALVHEMTRSLPFQVPQLAGETLRYHYLSDADMATASMITGIAPSTVFLRLWLVPIGAIAVLVVAVLGRDLAGRWWAGPLAGAAAFAGLPLALGSPSGAYGGGALVYASPSQTYAMPLIALLVTIVVEVLHRRPLRWGWLLVFPLALASAGAKESSVPPLVAGLILAALVITWQRRRIPWAVIGVLGATLAAMLIGLRLFAGGGAGTLGVQPLSVIRWMVPYSQTLGVRDGIAKGGLLPGGVAHAGLAGSFFIAWVISWWLLMQTPRLIGLGALITGRTRTDPTVWLLAGMITSGVAASWLLWHPSASQIYFLLCAIPFGVLLTVKLLASYVRWWPVPVLGMLAGALWVLVSPEVEAPARTMGAWSWALAVPVLRTGVAIVAGVLIAVVISVRRRGTPLVWARRLAVALIAAGLGGSIAVAGNDWTRAIVQGPLPAPIPGRAITAAEMRAALWLDENAGNDDVVATNVHCEPIDRPWRCDARAFWVAGLGGRRTVIESWGYSDDALAANGVDGLKYVLQPAADRERFALNERVFAGGSAADLELLERDYGVRWLLADSRAGSVSPALASLADVRLASGSVTIYELRHRAG